MTQPSMAHYKNLKSAIDEVRRAHIEIDHEVSDHVRRHLDGFKRRREELDGKLKLMIPEQR